MKNFNNKYTIRDFIDKNKWSNVYIAINKETNEQIVLNILINVEGNEENLENFKKEVNLILRCKKLIFEQRSCLKRSEGISLAI